MLISLFCNKIFIMASLNHSISLLRPFKNIDGISDSLSSSNPNESSINQLDINPYKETFKLNLQNKVSKIDGELADSKKKIKILKIAFVSLLVLGLICAASFVLLPALGAIATAVGLSLATTMIAWECIFLGGGLIASLSFVPRKFFLNTIDKRKDLNEQKNFFEKNIKAETEFERFLKEELVDAQFADLDIVVSSLDFANLYFAVLTKNERQFQLNQVENLYAEMKTDDASKSDHWKHKKSLKIVKKEIHTLKAELQNLDLEIDDIRIKLQSLNNFLIV